MSGSKPGRKPKGGQRHSIRFTHADAYARGQNEWKQLGFGSFSDYVDFIYAKALGYDVSPPQPCAQEPLPLVQEHAAA